MKDPQLLMCFNILHCRKVPRLMKVNFYSSNTIKYLFKFIFFFSLVEPTRKIKLEYISKDEAALSPLTKKIKSGGFSLINGIWACKNHYFIISESVDVVSGLKPREEPLYEASSSDTAIPRASRPHNSFGITFFYKFFTFYLIIIFF